MMATLSMAKYVEGYVDLEGGETKTGAL